MPKITWPMLANDRLNGALQNAAGVALTNTLTETIISQTGSDITFNPNELYPGKVIHFITRGAFSTAASAQGTLQLRLRWGGLAGTAVIDTGAVTPFASAANATWQLDGFITVRTEGASGLVIAIAQLVGLTSATSFAQVPATGSGTGVTINTTTSNALVLTAAWSVASASNTITCHQYIIEEMN